MGIGHIILASVAIVATPAAATIAVGSPAPHYVVRTFDKQQVDSTQLAGQVVIVNRWATWCGPCREELPALDSYYRAHQAEGLRIFAATIESSAPAYALKPLSKVLAFPLAYSIRGAFDPIGGAVPTSYVIDRRGVVRYAKAGAFDAQSLDAVIGPLLAEPVPAAPPAVAAR